MAQLVKLKTRPQKYYYRHQELLWPVNQIISRHDYEVKLDIKNNFFEFENQISHTLESYLNKWAQEIAKAHERGSLHRRQKILSQIITFALQWQNNITKEAKALLDIANKISNAILNTTVANYNSQIFLNNLEKKLRDFFYINIFIPDSIHKKLRPISDAKYIHIDNQKTYMKISLHGTSEEINLSGFNMRRMLSMAQKNIRAC